MIKSNQVVVIKVFIGGIQATLTTDVIDHDIMTKI